jgi:hypothetical protein
MIEYTLTHHHPRTRARTTKYNHPDERDASPSSRNVKNGYVRNERREDSTNAESDFMEMLFYDCKRGNVLEEFEKMVTYLTNEYFRPVNPEKCSRSSSSELDQPLPVRIENGNRTTAETTTTKTKMNENTSNFEQQRRSQLPSSSPFVDSLDSLLESSYRVLQGEYDKIMTDQEAQQDGLHHNANNEQCTENILETLGIMKRHVIKVESEQQERYVEMVRSLKQNMLFSLLEFGGEERGEDYDCNGYASYGRFFFVMVVVIVASCS